MNELMLSNDVVMNHVELCELINKFRLEEGTKGKLRTADLLAKIRKELDIMEQLGLSTERNFSFSEYRDKSGKKNATYIMNKYGILQISMSESVYVRAKVIEYIQALELKVQQLQEEKNKQLQSENTEMRKYIEHSRISAKQRDYLSALMSLVAPNTKIRKEIDKQLKLEFEINKLGDLLVMDFEDAVQFVQEFKGIKYKGLKSFTK